MMVVPLLVVAVLVMAAYWIGWYVGRGDGYADGRRERVDSMRDLIERTRFDEPGTFRLN